MGPGTEIDGTYRIVEKLGEGGMGAVYVAELIRLPKRVALKVLHVAADEAAKARFRREAEIAAKVHHPRIVEVLDYNFLEDGSPYLVMELLEGHDLRHRLMQGPLSPEEALPILRDVASALERLHGEGIVHRDLKPENIFLANEGDEVRAKVLDFGISKVVGAGTSLTAEQSVLGTPAYMSPEQVTGENASLDPRTDQFALAAVAYEMLSGRPAFQGEHVMQLFHQILTAPVPPLHGEGTTSPADPVFGRALAKDRAARFMSVGAFVMALSEAYGVEVARLSAVDARAATVAAPALARTEVAPALSRTEASTPAEPRSRGPLAAIAAAVLLTLGGVLAFALGRAPDAAEMAEAPATATSTAATDEGDEADDELAAAEDDESDEPGATGDDEHDDDDESDDDEPAKAPVNTTAKSGGTTSTKSGGTTSTTMAPADPTAPARPTPGRPLGDRPRDDVALSRLEEAERALASGDPQTATRLARASIAKETSDAARAVLVKAACDQHDLGLAKAMARGLKGTALRDAKQYCARRDVKL